MISARQQEFEKGFDRAGQTREHVRLACSLNVKTLLVVINKMDESTVQWSEARYLEICETLNPFLKKIGFKNVQFIPISGLSGANLFSLPTELPAQWYQGPTFMQALDSIVLSTPKEDDPLRITILDRYKDQGRLVIMGKVESGLVCEGDILRICPTSETLCVNMLESDFKEGSIKCAYWSVKIFILVLKGWI